MREAIEAYDGICASARRISSENDVAAVAMSIMSIVRRARAMDTKELLNLHSVFMCAAKFLDATINARELK